MSEKFFKFPPTPHLAVLGNISVRDDKVMSEQERKHFLDRVLVVEEKVDGANLGISFDSFGNIKAQSRGTYLQPPYSGQWKKISEWVKPKVDFLFDVLKDQYILFGEWCYAQHSVPYNCLPDWFLGFDIFDRQTELFLSCPQRDGIFRKLEISRVPFIDRGKFSFESLLSFLDKSYLSDIPAEGIYLRVDDGDQIAQRAKLVRPEFIQTVEEHWSRKAIKPNRLVPEGY